MGTSEKLPPYLPWCGTEGADFQARWCETCQHDADYRDNDGPSCPIIMASYEANEGDQTTWPKEWTGHDHTDAVCSAYEPVEGAVPLVPEQGRLPGC